MFTTVTNDPFLNQQKQLNRYHNKQLAKRAIKRAGMFAAVAVGTQLVINAVNNKSDNKSN